MEFGLQGGSRPRPGYSPHPPGACLPPVCAELTLTFRPEDEEPVSTSCPAPPVAGLNDQQSRVRGLTPTIGAKCFLSTYYVPVTVLASRDVEIRAQTWMAHPQAQLLVPLPCPLSFSAPCLLPCRMGKGTDPVGPLGDFRPQSTLGAKLRPPHHVNVCKQCPSLDLSLLLCDMGAGAPLGGL